MSVLRVRHESREVSISVSPDTPLAAVFSSACRSFRLSPRRFALLYKDRPLTLTLPFSRSGLVNRASLTLAPSSSPAVTTVRIALQLPDGTRLQASLSNDLTLWDMLLSFEKSTRRPIATLPMTSAAPPTTPAATSSASSSSASASASSSSAGDGSDACQVATLQIMSRRIEGVPSLAALTLFDVGIGSGSALIRLSYGSACRSRAEIDAEVQTVSATQQATQLADSQEAQAAHLERTQALARTSALVDQLKRQEQQQQQQQQQAAERQRELERRQALQRQQQLEHLEQQLQHREHRRAQQQEQKRQHVSSPAAVAAAAAAASGGGVDITDVSQITRTPSPEADLLSSTSGSSTAASATATSSTSAATTSDPTSLYPLVEISKKLDVSKQPDRRLCVFKHDSSVDSVYIPDDLPEHFYELTREDMSMILSRQRAIKRQQQQQQQQGFRTKYVEMISQAERAEKLQSNATVRITLPDQHTLQGVFHPKESLANLYGFVEHALAPSCRDHFYLFTAPPKQVLERSEDILLWQRGLIHKATVRIGTHGTEPLRLKDSLADGAIPLPSAADSSTNQQPTVAPIPPSAGESLTPAGADSDGAASFAGHHVEQRHQERPPPAKVSKLSGRAVPSWLRLAK